MISPYEKTQIARLIDESSLSDELKFVLKRLLSEVTAVPAVDVSRFELAVLCRKCKSLASAGDHVCKGN